MFESISLHHFKCFATQIDINLSRVNVFYGKNGRGKSSVAQVFLLLGQTFLNDDINYLQINGNLVKLGLFSDILSVNNSENIIRFEFKLKGLENKLIFAYQEDKQKPSIGKLIQLEADGKNLMEEKASSDFKQTRDSASTLSLTAISGYSGYENFKNIYFVSASRQGQVNSEQRNDICEKVGIKGENIINLLQAKGEEFQKKVSSVLSGILDGATLKAKDSATREYVDLFLDSKDNGEAFRPVNVGFGYSYILPIIVNMLVIPEGSVLIVENPEAHLFPAAQSRLMEFLVKYSQKRNIQVIVESHSDHVVNGVRIAVKKGEITLQDIVIDYFDRDTEGHALVKDIHVDMNGELDDYPDDFMDEWTKQLLQLV